MEHLSQMNAITAASVGTANASAMRNLVYVNNINNNVQDQVMPFYDEPENANANGYANANEYTNDNRYTNSNSINNIYDEDASAEGQTIIEERKKYRAYYYDEHDTTYATELRHCFYKYVHALICERFNKFTDNLMDDPQISRSCLLNAIADFETADLRLGTIFTDNAFNYRPHQACVIC